MKDIGDKFAKLPMWQKVVMLVLIWGLVGGGYYYLVYTDQDEALRQNQTSLTQLNKQIDELKVKVTARVKFEKRLQELEDQRKRALTFLPDEPLTDELNIELNRRAKQSQIRVAKIVQQSEVPMGFYARVPIQLNLEGTFHQLVIFFNLISEMKRIVNIQDVTFSEPQRRDGQVYLKAQALATCYRSIKEVPKARVAKPAQTANQQNFARGKKALKGKNRGLKE